MASPLKATADDGQAPSQLPSAGQRSQAGSTSVAAISLTCVQQVSCLMSIAPNGTLNKSLVQIGKPHGSRYRGHGFEGGFLNSVSKVDTRHRLM